MEFRHDEDVRLHVADVIRSYPTAVAGRTTLALPGENRDRIPGTEDIEATEGRTLVGYPIVFDSWTEIQSWDGPFLEKIDPRAADKTLQKRADKVQLMFNHGFDFTLEQTAIGRHLVFEPEAHGVYNEAVLVPEGTYDKVDLVAELIRMGAVYGQSFRFRVDGEEWRDHPETSAHNPKGIPERVITEFTLFESGPVTYPAYEATSVALRSDGIPSAVRSAQEFHLWCDNRGAPATVAQIVERARHQRTAKAAIRARSDKLALVAN